MGPDGSITVRGKAANGEGSIYREVDGAWRATYRVPGERGVRRVRGKTREEARARRDVALAAALAAGPRAASSGAMSGAHSLEVFCRWWLQTIAKHRVRPSSFGRYEDRVEHIVAGLGSVRLKDLRPDQIATWQSALLVGRSASTVSDVRSLLRTIISEAVSLGLVEANPVDRVKSLQVRRTARRALTAAEARSLVRAASSDDRLGAAVALLFVQGWRVSEALGLAWSDVDLEGARATVRRACVYVDGLGMVLAPPKTEGVEGEHFLAPVVVELLGRRKAVQDSERLVAGAGWQGHTYEGRSVEPIFTTTSGGLMLRQAVAKAIANAAESCGIDSTGLGTHSGRSTAITALYSEEGVDLADVARHVGHANPSTTAGYVRNLGRRPKATADAASRLLDPTVTPR